MDQPDTSVNVQHVMRDITGDLRRERQARLVARGGPAAYADPDVYQHVEQTLRRAVEVTEHDVRLMPELLGDEDEWQLQTHLRFSSHRGAIGRVIVFAKRHILLPLTRWLFEYSLENFRRQQRVNQRLLACIEELAIENAQLRRDLRSPRAGRDPGA
jgi:hypothetical protein